MKNIDCSNFIVIIWWAFQWKSLISLKIASKLNYSWVISTDYIRNFLRVSAPTKEILSSTSQMSEKIFNKQRSQISDFLYKNISFYTDRQEKMILEWIHFSNDLILFLKNNWAKIFWVNNTIAWNKKVILKSITTPIIKLKKNNIEILEIYNKDIHEEDIVYIQVQKQYELMHKILLKELIQIWIKIIEYNNIKKWVDKILFDLR